MAIHYVFSGATGSNNGTSWANAWTSIASAVGVAAGDEVRVHKTHSETLPLAAYSFSNGTISAPVRIFVVDKDNSDARSSGATLTFASGASISGHIIVDGMSLVRSASTLDVGFGLALQRWINCSFTGLIQYARFNGAHLILENCSIDTTGETALTFVTTLGGKVHMVGGSVALGTQDAVVSLGASAVYLFEGVTFTGSCTNLVSQTSALGQVILRECNLPTFSGLSSNAPANSQFRVRLERCSSGTISATPLGLTWELSQSGDVKGTLSRYRDNGANDGEQANEHSWEMASSASAAEMGAALESPPIVRWVDAGEQDLTIYLASDSTLQNDEFWITVLSPSESGTPTAQSAFRTTMCLPGATPADLTVDGDSTWNGSDVSVPQKITVTIDPAVAGPVTVRCFLAKPSTTVYVDPLIEVS